MISGQSLLSTIIMVDDKNKETSKVDTKDYPSFWLKQAKNTKVGIKVYKFIPSLGSIVS